MNTRWMEVQVQPRPASPPPGTLRALVARMPVDPDLQAGARPLPARVAAVVIAAGGALGALARHGLTVALPHPPGAWPWATWWTNVAGSALLAVLLVVLLERVPPSRYAAPFLGTGVLGGFTTFSTFAVDAVEISDAGRSWLAAVYVATSILAALAAAFIALVATRAGLRLPEHRRARRGEPDAAAEESLP